MGGGGGGGEGVIPKTIFSLHQRMVMIKAYTAGSKANQRTANAKSLAVKVRS